ncbi:SH3 domain binding glutamate rich protein [Phyllostomus discolor]|uniref:SH3 domain binding glutamate rich protein n=1 Tax=Phyllostomus discolor TaxID=89673 RepID=A0A834ELJ4_9CHIR|nr:SH3 domain binding glutamate rich protein [Phyllostomus discolor]
MFLERKNLRTGFPCLPRSSTKNSIVGILTLSSLQKKRISFIRSWVWRPHQARR